VAQEPEKTAQPRGETKQFVEYKPTGGRYNFHAREITSSQWKRAGVEDQKTVVWNHGNDFRVPIGDFNADALKLLEGDSELVTVEA